MRRWTTNCSPAAPAIRPRSGRSTSARRLVLGFFMRLAGRVRARRAAAGERAARRQVEDRPRARATSAATRPAPGLPGGARSRPRLDRLATALAVVVAPTRSVSASAGAPGRPWPACAEAEEARRAARWARESSRRAERSFARVPKRLAERTARRALRDAAAGGRAARRRPDGEGVGGGRLGGRCRPSSPGSRRRCGTCRDRRSGNFHGESSDGVVALRVLAARTSRRRRRCSRSRTGGRRRA